MKKKLIFALSMLAATFAFAQNKNVEEVNVTAPQFTGTENVLLQQSASPTEVIKTYLKKNAEFPLEAELCRAEGTEVVQFVVTADGNVSDFKIINSVCPEIDNEIIYVLKNTNGMWLPGYKNGLPVDMMQEVSLIYSLEKKSSEEIAKTFSEKAINHFNTGSIALFEKGNVKKALKAYNNGIKYLPNDGCLLYMRGLCRYELNDIEGAREDWKRLTGLGDIEMSEFTAQMENMKGFHELMAILKK